MNNAFERKPPREYGDAGYTLMELLVVLAILGLLTAIAAPFVIRYLDSAKVRTARTEISNIGVGLDLFKFDVGRYPDAKEGLQALLSAPPNADGWNGPYLKKATALNDPWGNPYVYEFPGKHGDFDIYSVGADGKASSDKPAISNW